ncbi:MAG: thiamine phosphate synthase [Nitrospirae bacterium]|nr:thiamine phosphate synthase [Nitrospirota bacterium]
MLPVDFPVYLVTDRHQTAGRPLLTVVEQALSAGVRAVQLRERDLGTRPLLALARDMRELTARFGAALLINDRVDLALAVGADGVHLRATSLPVQVVRRLVGPERLIGLSTHSVSDVERAETDGADFVLLGPVYETPSKREYGPPIGLAPIEAVTARCRIPVLGIGGVSAERMAELRRVGASGAAVISAILSAPRVGDATLELLAGWRRSA